MAAATHITRLQGISIFLCCSFQLACWTLDRVGEFEVVGKLPPCPAETLAQLTVVGTGMQTLRGPKRQGKRIRHGEILTFYMTYSQVGYIRATWPWARPLPAALKSGSGEGHGKFQALWPLASLARGRALAHAQAGARARSCARALPKHPKPLAWVNLLKKEPQALLALHPTYVLRRPMADASQGKVRSDSKPCSP